MKTKHHPAVNLLLSAALLAAVVLGASPALKVRAEAPGAAPVSSSAADASGTWTPTGSMGTPRFAAEAILLPTGKVMMMGGAADTSGGVVASAELYDQATGAWNTTGSMNYTRCSSFATVLLPDGKLLVAGGCNGGNGTTAELYDPATGVWSPTGSMAESRMNFFTALLPNGKVLVAGGWTVPWGSVLASAELYDPVTGTWSPTGGMNQARTSSPSNVLLPSGKVLVTGGYDAANHTLASTELYDPTTGAWSPAGNMNQARWLHSITLLTNGKVLAAGGYDGTGTELYDPETDTWSPTGSMITARSNHSAVLLPNGSVLVAGAADDASAATAEIYDPATGTWSAAGSISEVRKYLTATLLPNGAVLVAGGYNGGSGVLASAELYTPADPVVHLGFNPAQAALCAPATVAIDLNNVSGLYGYQFQVNYDPSQVSASGAFVNSFFDTSANAAIPTGWAATCAAGVCKFAVSKVEASAAVSGSGSIAQLTFSRVSGGEGDVTISSAILSDRDANALPHTTNTLHLTVCGQATVSGVVTLQGRQTPINAGTVTLTDLANSFPSTTVPFDAVTGAFTASVPVAAGGSSYQLDATHGLYLGNRQTHTLNPGDVYAASTTRLKGGDATNEGLIDISDITCIGGAFGGPPVTCGATGSSDINADSTVNILDLVLAGGNYGLSAPQPW